MSDLEGAPLVSDLATLTLRATAQTGETCNDGGKIKEGTNGSLVKTLSPSSSRITSPSERKKHNLFILETVDNR